MDQSRTRFSPGARTGHTLIELAISLTIVSILLLAIGSAIMLAARAIPSPGDPASTAAGAARAADEIAADLAFALSFAERSASAVEFTVADRAGAAAPETIRYAWSGTPGDPLTRQYSGGAPAAILDDVRQFALAWDQATVAEPSWSPVVESAETVLSSRDPAVTERRLDITAGTGTGQLVAPGLPPEALCWKVNRAMIRARSHSSNDGRIRAQLRLPASGALPSSAVLADQLLLEGDMSGSYNWEETAFGLADLPPGQALCLVYIGESGSDTLAQVPYDLAGVGGRTTTADGGASWTSNGSETLVHYVYGTATSFGPASTVTRTYLTGARITLRAGDDTAAPASCGTLLLHVTEVGP